MIPHPRLSFDFSGLVLAGASVLCVILMALGIVAIVGWFIGVWR